jgi:hypothetical protein
MRRQSKAVEPTVPNLEAMWNMDPRSLETLTQAYRAWFSQATRMHDETMRFARERFTKEFETVVQLTRCTNPGEALAVQAEFANRLAEDYITEAQRMIELVSEMTTELSSSPNSDRARH